MAKRILTQFRPSEAELDRAAKQFVVGQGIGSVGTRDERGGAGDETALGGDGLPPSTDAQCQHIGAVVPVTTSEHSCADTVASHQGPCEDAAVSLCTLMSIIFLVRNFHSSTVEHPLS